MKDNNTAASAGCDSEVSFRPFGGEADSATGLAWQFDQLREFPDWRGEKFHNLGFRPRLRQLRTAQLPAVHVRHERQRDRQFDSNDVPTLFTYDGNGNMTSRSTPLNGHLVTWQYSYNNFGELLTMTDPLGNTTSLSYDPNGNVLSLSDALTHGTTWTYDTMDRVFTRTDPLKRQESFGYDLNGNLVSATDRKGQVTTFQYDGLNRLTFAGFGTQGSGSGATYASTISYSYDGGNRLTQAVDSVSGTITEGYDNLDRPTSETTPQGSITYG